MGRNKYEAMIYFVSVLLLAMSSVIYADHTRRLAEEQNTRTVEQTRVLMEERTNAMVRETERKFCDIINTVVNAYDTSPGPTTELGKKLKQQYVDLQERLGCS